MNLESPRERACACALAGCLASLACAPTAAAQERVTPAPTPIKSRFDYNFHRNHDRGVYGRLSAGLAYMDVAIIPPAEGAGLDREAGARGHYAGQLGYLVAPRLSVGLAQWSQLGGTRGVLGAGPAVTFYFKQDRNLFISAAVGAQTVYDEAPDIRLGEQWGLGTELELGTGWWISRRAAFGLSFAGGAAAFDLDGDHIAAQGWHAGLRLTLSMN